MGMPIEDQALEVVQNDAELNIHKGKIAAFKALMQYLQNGKEKDENFYVPELPVGDQRLDSIHLTSYNSVRNAWIAMYENWEYPDIFIVVESTLGAIYTQVNKRTHRTSDLSDARLF